MTISSSKASQPSEARTRLASRQAIAFTPREIVSELDRFIIGQNDAKRAVAIALRNRWRRQQLPEELREEVLPKNILMIGPTGVGKTEIARRLARLAQSPFIKVEASKFTEVGYVGRDVESMVRDLVELAVGMVRDERVVEVREKAAGIDKRLETYLVTWAYPRTMWCHSCGSGCLERRVSIGGPIGTLYSRHVPLTKTSCRYGTPSKRFWTLF